MFCRFTMWNVYNCKYWVTHYLWCSIYVCVICYNVSYIDGLVQDCSISIANALEILQSCTKPSICYKKNIWIVRFDGLRWTLVYLSVAILQFTTCHWFLTLKPIFGAQGHSGQIRCWDLGPISLIVFYHLYQFDGKYWMGSFIAMMSLQIFTRHVKKFVAIISIKFGV